MALTTLQQVIIVDAAKPEVAIADGITVRKRPLTELIAADRYVQGAEAVLDPAGCLTRVRIIQPGTVSESLTT